MLQIPSIKMRTLLIRYMIENFQASTARFIIQEQVGEVTLGAVDVECIFNLENQGLSASDILTEEGEDFKEWVPPQFLTKTSENIVIDNLIEDIIKSKATDDDFLRKVVLVLLGTIIAPMSSKIVPKQYYALVDDVKRISKINWNAFTLRVLLDCLRIVKKGKHLRQWPKGNLALLQYLYSEKVQPVEGECAYNPNLSIQPLMRNWTEGAATRRDRFDYDNGRGCGNVKIENNITQEYRAQESKIPNNAPTMKPKTKPANGNARKSTTAPMSEDLMELLMKQCMDFIHTQMRQIPDQVAERLLEKLNKSGVMYKPAAAVPSADNDVDEELDLFENGPYEKKEFVYKDDIDSCGEPVIDMTQPDEAVPNHKSVPKKTPPKMNGHKEASPIKRNDECGATPENPWVVGTSTQAPSSDIDICPSSGSKFMAKANGRKGATIDKDEEVMSGKRKRTVPKKFESPYALDKPSRRTNRGQKPSGTTTASRGILSFLKNHEPEVVADELTPEIIDAAVSFFELAASTEKNKGKKVYYSEWRGISLTSERIRPVIDAYMGHLELRVGHDRYLCPAWRSKFLVDCAIARDDPLPSSCNMDSALSKAGAVNRVTKEYTVRDKTYIALNIDNAHWMTVVMHLIKKEFQVLDSLYPLDLTEKTVKALVANLITQGKYPNVSKWPIKEYDMPQQEDGSSCGLFVTECLEHWDGARMTRDFSQATVDARRRRFVAELIMSPSNTMECVKNKIREIARKRRA
ncbi:uncharacterized protein [Aegilops tauschii subsp. strangulata]|uniref:uncharacterized protein n=1 Tax=Aegilops tauschii subsp. strangulata TaxID=200361 RepID=UPI00098B6729|nr:uncharacterized protein LOC109742450 [Aegilops tauschii subsp. strangulata]